MRVLVMGGTRFNGLALVRELVRHGHEVTVFNRGQTEAKLPHGVRRLLGDRHDHPGMREVFRDEEFDCIQDISAYTLDDVRSMVEIFEGRIAHYIFASSTVIYATSNVLPVTEDHPVDRSELQSEYGMNKLICEDYLLKQHRERGFPATIIPFSMVFGPDNFIQDREQRMFVRLLEGRPVLIPGDGTTVSQVGHVDDEARALRSLMLRNETFGKRFNLTGRDYWTDEGYVDACAAVVGVEPRKVFVPCELMDALWFNRLDGITAPEHGRDEQGYRRSLVGLIQRLAPNLHPWNHSMVFSSDRLRRATGWEPDYTFPAAVEQTYEWFRSEGLHEAREFDFRFEDGLLALAG